ncbi:ATP-dependent Clp protease proteolytic subunit 4, chloroplastic [Impatiens glandulifera]|uniref:ATP-dependent Clp protease proteolytic subunit 4, chloroplastic n=1 Tax=Impatiens glandulifera TaxID=253017 RepID=UPI001FB0FD4E|nr:ATP-dependent Clp protease proteolytic subunit 4, chloroplastic [Impatiens glandulifera]
MDLLSISAPLASNSIATCRSGIVNLRKKSLSRIQSFSIRPHLSFSTRCSIAASPKVNSGFPDSKREVNDYSDILSPYASQSPATGMRGADSDAMGLLLRERIVFLGSSIDDFVADAIISQLLLLDAQDPTKDIRLFINSTGGSLSATMAIYDVVQLVRADVSTVALGIAASTASIILGGGTKGKRFAMPNTRVMIHQPLGGASGQAIDVEIQAKEIMHSKDNLTRIVSAFTGRSYEQVQKDIDRDRYMSPIEAVEYGIIDGVIDRDTIIPLEPVPENVKASIFNYEEISKDPRKYLTPDIPDDEIY